MIDWKISKEDSKLVGKIVERAMKLKPLKNDDVVDVRMDIHATHTNGCKLDLVKFLGFDEFNFAHDVMGITNHIDRTTGKLTDCFLPRCSR